MKSNSSKNFLIPDDAHMRYGAKSGSSGKILWFSTEEEARELAAGWSGDGSGEITKLTKWTYYSNNGKQQLVSENKITETLKPVTKFAPDGENRRKRFLLKKNCKHKKTYSRFQGAGCQTWTETYCANCGSEVY